MEDLHWADASTRDLLVFLLRNLRDVPLHLIVSVRTDDLHRPIPSGGCCPNSNGWDRVRRIEVGPLDHGQVAAQAAAVRGAPLGRTDAALLHERTGGNPLFVESFLAADSGTPGGGPIPAGPRELLLAAVAPPSTRPPERSSGWPLSPVNVSPTASWKPSSGSTPRGGT